MRLTRRGLLVAGGAVATAGATGALVEHDRLPGRSRAHALLGLTGEPGTIPDAEPGERDEGRFTSAHVEVDPHWVITHPPGVSPGARLPVVVALHGAGRTAEAWFDELGVDQFLAASGHRFAVAAVDGGLRSFWHERSDGQDPGRMLHDEFLPLLADRGLSLAGVLGWSMGGLGALLLGSRLADQGDEQPVLAVSPALWPEHDQAMPEAYDTEEQYDEATARAREQLARESRVDCGTADPFYRDVRAVIDGIDVEQHYEQGAHDAAYWTRVLPGQLDWLAARTSAS